jgi:deoxyribodipyrimidine photolyase-related protein
VNPDVARPQRPTLTFIAPWECSRAVARIPRAPRPDVVVLLVESVAKGAELPWHRQKLVLILSTLRHFAEELRAAGYVVDHRVAPSYEDAIVEAAREHNARRVVCSEPREWQLLEEIDRVAPRLAALGIALERREDPGFIAPRAVFDAWARGRKELRMEWFYRELRRTHQVLMEPDGSPTGGTWNFDSENRKPWPKARAAPARFACEPDALTQSVMAQVGRWKGRWGAVDGFSLPVTRRDALTLLERFMTERLPEFGPYEDAMQAGETDLLHSTLSSVINVGLLHPMEVVKRAERAYREGAVPLPSAEGFIRQILGWREFVRGIYWRLMPGLRTANALGADRTLPLWYWAPDGEAGYAGAGTHGACRMRCLADTVRSVRDHGRVHHIPRLMVQGNIATLLGVTPEALSRWFWAAFTDAYEWVELPNVAGMATWGDGGVMASKPYVASGAYINRMSNYCSSCSYDVTRRSGEGACPVNVLYWDFLARHRERFVNHPRMAMMIRNLDRLDADELVQIRRSADRIRDEVPWEPPGPFFRPPVSS